MSNDLTKQHAQLQHAIAMLPATAPHADAIRCGLEAMKDALALLARSERTTIIHAIQKLELKPGDVLFVKLGDPATGWIPSQEHADRFGELLRQAFEEAGVPNKVCVVLWDYAADAAVVRAAT